MAVTLFALTGATRADIWATAYYAGWMQGYMPASNVDYSAFSHIIHFSLVPNSNGTISSTVNVVNPPNSTDLVPRVHAAGRKVLISVGGADSAPGFQGATSSANLGTFITNIVNFMSTYGYDGVDLDWEPLGAADTAQFTNLVNGLRTRLDSFPQRKLLTAAVASLPSLFASLQSKFDQINLMTYDLSGPWAGWVTWFNSPVYDGGYRFASTGGLVPSINGTVTNYIAAGISPGKLGIGMDFYGKVWSGGAGTSTGGAALPRQGWTTAPTITDEAYYSIMTNYYQAQRYFWDTNAQAAYLSIDSAGSANDKFISYDDEHSCQAKISYARNQRLGGVMIWELGGGYRANQPSGSRDPLVQALKQGLATPRVTSIQMTGRDIQLSFSTLPLGLYRVEWSSNLTGSSWNTATNNVAGTGGSVQITDPGVGAQSQRFYRVVTPP